MAAPSVHEVFDYCPVSGEIRWKIDRSTNIKAGDLAGSIARDGYRVLGFAGKVYRAHRVAWLIMTGEWPSASIDHRNCNRSDNRWNNLRLATISQNNANTRARGHLPKGATLHKQTGKYKAQITKNGVHYYLGLFVTPIEANSAYEKKAAELFGEFARSA